MCVSVNQHLTPGVSVRPENSITYLTGNEDQKNLCGFLLNHSVALPALYGYLGHKAFVFIYMQKQCIRIIVSTSHGVDWIGHQGFVL